MKAMPFCKMFSTITALILGFFSPLAPQAIVDDCARILDVSQDADNFYALLDGKTRCAICRHVLRDEVSKLVGVGPDCAQRYGIPHTLAAASKRLELRRTLLGETAAAQ